MFSGDYQPCYEKSFALVVGINDYEHMPPLTYARADADAIAAILVSKLGFLPRNVTLLKDRQATRSAVMDALDDLTENADSPDDRAIIFLAGHGAAHDGYRNQVGYFVPADGKSDKPASLIRWQEMIDRGGQIPAKHILFIFDACFSGLAFTRAVYPKTKSFLSQVLQRRCRQVITAGTAGETVADGGSIAGGNSIFTGYLLEGINGKAIGMGGILSASALMYYVAKNLAHDPMAHQLPQYGLVDGDGDFILLASGYDLEVKPEHDQLLEPEPEMAQIASATVGLGPTPNNLFLEQNGYRNPLHPNFGRNNWSSKLGIMMVDHERHEVKAPSWLSVVVEPISSGVLSFDIGLAAKRFKNYTLQGRSSVHNFSPPKQTQTTQKSLILFEPLSFADSSTLWSRYVRIEQLGQLELCDSQRSFYSFRDQQAFRFVQVIGVSWQFLYFAKSILAEQGHKGAARLTVNFVSTKDTILADFAKQSGPDGNKWLQPGEQGVLSDGAHLLNLKCQDQNLQMQYNLILERLDDENMSKETITDLAAQLGLAYNQQSEPKCFVHGTTDFPWQQYMNGRQ